MRARCELASRRCWQQDEAIWNQATAKKLNKKNIPGFWKEIRNMNATQTKILHCIDGFEGEHEVASLWMSKLYTRFNCVQGSQSQIHEYLCGDRIEKVTAKESCILRGQLNVNNLCGADKPPADIYKYDIGTLYARLFNIMLESSFMPEKLELF